MKNNETPGHLPYKGYPFVNQPVSRRMFPNRPTIELDLAVKEVFIGIDPTVYPNNPVWPEKRTPVESFLMDRLLDYSEALKAAEGQIEDMMRELPFVPEDFGFEVISSQDFISMPTTIFENKYMRGTCIFRRTYDVMDESMPINMWTIIKVERTEEGVIKTNTSIDVNLPCRRIAYAVLFSLGIPMTDPNAPVEVVPENVFDVKFERPTTDEKPDLLIIEAIPADTEEEAIEKGMEWVKAHRPEFENLKQEEFSVRK